MRHVKYLLTSLLAIVAALAVSATAFAAGTGSITITPPDDVDTDQTITYTIYKVFDADGNGENISYKLVSGKTTAPAGFTVDSAGNVSFSGDLTQSDIDAIAAYVTDADIVGTATSTGGNPAVIDNLPNGYYYITTTTGTAVIVNSTNPNVEVKDKNTVPTVDKKITGASSYDADGKQALAQVGTSVNYAATITVGEGATGYVFKDTMGAGLSYNGDLAVTDGTEGTDYSVAVSGNQITVTFEDSFVTAQDTIVITYSATVTSDALQDDPANNTATISYGNNQEFTSQPSETKVYNAKFTVAKQDGNGDPLPGAGFVIKNGEGNYYKLENGVVSWVASIDDATEHVSDSTGSVQAFTGLADGTYTLVEKTVPAGYNKAADSTFTINAGDYTASNLNQEATVTNNAGSELPSTGGMGTTILYVIGAACVIGAGVYLFRKKRLEA